MTAALILLIALLVVGGVLYAEHKVYRRRHPQPEGDPQPEVEQTEEECCGMHITCERDSLIAGLSTEVEYYDDEELDRHKDRTSDSYTDNEIEEFRDILLTLRTDEIAGWARSLQLRGITLPDCVREELLMIVAEARANASKPQSA